MAVLESFHHLVGYDADPLAWWQMCIRAVIVFVWALILYRLLPRRALGGNAVVDIIVVVIAGSALSRALTGTAPLLPTIAATALLALLYGLLSILAWRSNAVSFLVKGRQTCLIRDGRVDWQALHAAQLGERDLMENLRIRGVESVDQVREANLERNGEITVIRKN